MKYWNITVDVDTVYRTRVEADTEEEAREMAEQEAYEDTWGTDMSWSSCKVYDCEQVTAEGLPLEDDEEELSLLLSAIHYARSDCKKEDI